MLTFTSLEYIHSKELSAEGGSRLPQWLRGVVLRAAKPVGWSFKS
jgi:hypothetical protein